MAAPQATVDMAGATPAQPSAATILYVNATSELSGTDTDLFATVRALDKRRFHPIVVLPHRGPFDDAYAAMGVEVLHFELPALKRRAPRAALVKRFGPSVAEFVRLIRSRQVDLVYTNSLMVLSAGVAARLTGRPALWHSGELLDRPRMLGKAIYSTTGALADRIVVSSEAVGRRFPGWARHKVTVLHNGIDLERFRPAGHRAATRAALELPAEAPVVGFVGRFMPWKGIELFLDVATRVLRAHPAAHFLICGSRLPDYPDYPGHVRRQIDERGLTERLLLVEDRTDVPDLLAAMDVFVHCSVRPEPFGIVIVEAMAAGKPVVAANAGGVPEIVTQPEVGVLVPLGDAEATACAVSRLLAEPERACAMGMAARAHVERRFEIGAVTRRAEALYTEALARRSR
jgi:glycosyltransferase involved in cell wall biosynthesis